MGEYKNFIESLMKKGVSLDEIAAEFSNAMNEVEKKDNREDYLGGLYEGFDRAYQERNICIADVADLATVVVANDAHSEWTIEQCKEFREYIETCMTYGAGLIGLFVEEAVNKALEDISKLGTTEIKVEPPRTDASKLAKFFEELGL